MRLKRQGLLTVWGLLGAIVAFSAGCQEAVRPVRVGVTKMDLIGPNLLPEALFGRWEALRLDLGLYLGLDKFVHIELLKPRQIRVHLGTGREAFAIVDAVEYAEIITGDNDVVLASAVNGAGNTERVGLIVTRADSPVQSLGELKGKRFDFGPKGDPLMDVAAVCALSRAGVRMADIEKDKLLGEYRHLFSQDVAKAVVYEKVPAGIIDEAEYNKWPDKGGSLLLGTVSKDQLRVLDRTPPVPEMVVLASKRTDPALVAKVRNYFLEDVNKKQLTVLTWLGVKGFRAAQREQYVPFAQLVRAVYPPAPPSSEPAAESRSRSRPELAEVARR